MIKENLSKPIWLVLEPFFYPHSEGYLRAIIDDENIRKKFDIVYIYGGVESQMGLMCELQNLYGPGFRPIEIKYSKRTFFGYVVTALIRNWKVMRAAQQLTKKVNVDYVSILRADDLIRLLFIPGMRFFFNGIAGRITGVFFNSRCFRESSFTLNFLSRGVCRIIKSRFFVKLLFLDHGVCNSRKLALDPSYGNIVGKAVDPWTSHVVGAKLDVGLVSQKKTLLTLGAHSIRKGTLSLLKMFRDFPDELANYKLLIVGPIRDDIRREFNELLAQIVNYEDKIEYVDRYVSDDRSWDYFQRSHMVICPYVDFHGSSNVVIRAAAIGLSVVTPSFGYLGEVTESKGIGATYKNQEPVDILGAILKVEKLLEMDALKMRNNSRKYAEEHNQVLYAKSLLPPLYDY
jgi:glycosyltransferase involved in cell wall biosynthesis